jgi:hypothetical protein
MGKIASESMHEQIKYAKIIKKKHNRDASQSKEI